MPSSGNWRRHARRVALGLACVGLSLPAWGQEEDPDIFFVINNGRDIPGSLDDAITFANDGTNTHNEIRFGVGELEFLTLVLGSEPVLPDIDLLAADPSAERQVDLDATDVLGFQINTATDVGADFVLLHVVSGQATLVNLDIFGTALDEEGEPIRSQFVVDAGATLGFRYDGDHAIDDNVTGGGSVVKEGPATLRLGGTNTYSGGTEVKEGELLGHHDSIQGDIVVDEGALLTFEDLTETATHIYVGEITGEGSLIKTGSHILQFSSGKLAVTGGIEIVGGTLSGDTETISGDVSIRRDALFQLSQTQDGEYAGDITGEGSLEKAGIFDLTLSGENTFSGGIEVVGGDLFGSSQSIPGNIVLTQTSSQVFFDQSEEIGDGVHSGSISGEGKLIKLGPRTLTLSGTSSYAGGTEVQDGTLRGDARSLRDNIFVSSATAAVEFAIDDSQTFSSIVSGPGDFVKSGAGSLTLTDQNSHSGATRIDGGALRVAAALSGTSGVTVAAGASLVNAASDLGQFGTSVAGNLESLGGIELGGSAAFLRVFRGDASLEPGSSLAVTVNELGQSSLLQVDQAAVVDGVEFIITAEPGLYTHPDPYVLMTAASFTAGAQGLGFTSPDFAFLDIGDPTISPGGGDLTITISPNSAELSDFAETPNQIATAPALGEVLASGSPDADELLRNLSVVSASQVPKILDQVSGESLGAFSNPRLADAYALFQAVSRRFTANDYAGGPVARRPAESAGPPAQRLGAWLEGVGIFSRQSGEINASDIDANNGGLIAGFDTTLRGEPSFRLGAALAYTRLSIDGSRGLEASGNTYQAALYASWEHEGAYLGIAGRYGYSDMQTDRRIGFEDIDRRAQGESSGQEGGVLIEVGARLGDPTRLAYRPFLRLQYNHLSQQALQETGAGDLSLAAEAQEFDVGRSTLGVRISSLFTLGGEFGIEPEIRAGWSHDFGDLARPVVARFYTVPGALPFTTLGAETDPDNLFVGMGYLMRIADVPLVGLDYDFYAGDGYKVHVLSAQLYMRW